MITTVSPERKFVCSQTEGDFALAWLEHTCKRDPEYPFGIVSSIYFDTPSRKMFFEKENGDLLKIKVRLRWYKETIRSESDTIKCFLEIKERIGSGRQKARAKMDVNARWINTVGLSSPEVAQLVMKGAPDYEYLFRRNLFPMMTVVYKRHRFICPCTGARVCLDTSIHSDRVNVHHLAGAVPEAIDTIVLEVKDAGFAELPWMDELYSRGFREGSFSKYYECMIKSQNGGVDCE